MQLITPILALLVVQIQALPSPATNVHEISGNEALTLPTVSKQLDFESPPANEVPGTSPNEALTLATSSKRLDRRVFGFGGCGSTSAWPTVQAVFFPPRPRRIDINMPQAQHNALGFRHNFETVTVPIESEVTVPLWNPATGSFGTVVSVWNRTEQSRRVVVIVEVAPNRGTQGPTVEHRINIEVPGGLPHAVQKCMIKQFGANKNVKMYMWIEGPGS